MELNRKAIYFTMDALLAGFLLIGATLLVINSSFFEEPSEQKTFVSRDLLTTLSELRIYEIDNTFVAAEIANGNITDVNKTVLEQAGEYWALNKTSKAKMLLEVAINESVPNRSGINIVIGDDNLFLRNLSTRDNVVSANRMISGIDEGKPILGSSASAYLEKIRNKKTSSYAYFGGFVGQGNITVKISLPSDFNSTRLITAELKIDVPGTFTLYINGDQCGSTYTGSATYISHWDVSMCNESLSPLDNDVSLRFTSTLNTSYVSGGFVKVTYTTDTLKENVTEGYKRYHFPEIEGFFNMYDAVATQGLIRNWTLNITYYNEYYTYFTFGNETIFITPGTNTTQSAIYSRMNQSLPPTSIPIRFGVTNFSNITVLDIGLPSDSFLVTDVSGSMDDCSGIYYNATYCEYEYKGAGWWWWWSDSSCPYTGSCTGNQCNENPYFTSRNHQVVNASVCYSLLDIAKQADKLFVEIILNASALHRIGLVDYSTNANTPTVLTNNEAVLDSEIDTYSPGGSTCICCGINRARDLINSSTNKKFMIVMSDGEANQYCSSFNDYTGTGGSTSLSSSWAINASRLACQNNITVYSIGFGSAMGPAGHAVMQQIACNSSLYFNATDVSTLVDIYRNISQQILVAANFSSQTINVYGNYSQTRIYPDSYIDLYFDPVNESSEQSKLSLTIESDQFGSCDYTAFIPEGLEVTDASVTSYSGSHWTDLLIINGQYIYNLSEYGTNYQPLGDPFLIQIPSPLLVSGAQNNISLRVADSPTNISACSPNNTLIYQALINSSTVRTDTLSTAQGCIWEIETDSGNLLNVTIPSNYAGSNSCSYTNVSGIWYNDDDAYDVAVFDLLDQLDYNDDGRIFVDITKEDLQIIIIATGSIPYMWGPSIVRTDVWQ